MGLCGRPWNVGSNGGFASRNKRGASEGIGLIGRVKRNRHSAILDRVDLAIALMHSLHASLDIARVEREGGATLVSRHAEKNHQWCASHGPEIQQGRLSAQVKAVADPVGDSIQK